MKARWRNVAEGVSDWSHKLISSDPFVQGQALFSGVATAASFFEGGIAEELTQGMKLVPEITSKEVFQLNRFHQAVRNLPEAAKQNTRILSA